MPEPLLPHHLTEKLAEAHGRGIAHAHRALGALARIVEVGAKRRSREGGQHRYGTPTPASKGRGPAVISGDLSRSISHTPIETSGAVWSTRVGPTSTPHTTYATRGGKGGRGTTSGKIGKYLETGLRGGATYPFLMPAFHDGMRQAPEVWAQSFRPWNR